MGQIKHQYRIITYSECSNSQFPFGIFHRINHKTCPFRHLHSVYRLFVQSIYIGESWHNLQKPNRTEIATCTYQFYSFDAMRTNIIYNACETKQSELEIYICLLMVQSKYKRQLNSHLNLQIYIRKVFGLLNCKSLLISLIVDDVLFFPHINCNLISTLLIHKWIIEALFYFPCRLEL